MTSWYRVVLPMVLLVAILGSGVVAPSNNVSATVRPTATQSELPGTLTFDKSTNTGSLIESFDVASGVHTDIAAGQDPYQSQDGEIIFLDAGLQQITIRDTTGHQTIVVTDTSAFSILSNPLLSPDGSRFAYRGRCDECTGQPSGVIIRDRVSKQFVGGFQDLWPEDWTSGGQLVMTGATSSPTEGIWISTPDLQQASRVDQNMPGKLPRVRPDGQRIAFVWGDHVWVMQIDGSNPVQITTSASLGVESYPTWSPDGKYILVLAGFLTAGTAYLVSPDQETQMPPFGGTSTLCSSSLTSPCELTSTVENFVLIIGRVSWRSPKATTVTGPFHVWIPMVQRNGTASSQTKPSRNAPPHLVSLKNHIFQ